MKRPKPLFLLVFVDVDGRRWTLPEDQMVGRVGIEPTTNGLKVQCSTD